MARHIDADKLMETIEKDIEPYKSWDCTKADVIMDAILDAPAADVVEVETLKAWLYEIAINNVGCVLDGDFSDACQEIISRLDGLRKFAKERK